MRVPIEGTGTGQVRLHWGDGGKEWVPWSWFMSGVAHPDWVWYLVLLQ